jgi:hypothetical protein
MGPAGNPATGVRTDNFGDEGDMRKAGGRAWASDIGLPATGKSGTQSKPAGRELAHVRGRRLHKLSSMRRFTSGEFATAP